MNTPIKYFGGKGNQIKKILSHLPNRNEYNSYLEPYGGSGVILINKPKCDIEIWNDLDNELWSLYMVLKDKRLFEKFRFLAEITPYSEIIREQCIKQEPTDIVELAFKFWYVNRTSYNGHGGFNQSTTVVRRNMTKAVSDYLSSVSNLQPFYERWRTVFVYNRDALELIKKYDKKGFLFYLDPPYVKSTRKSNAEYNVDQNDSHHENLIDLLLSIKNAKVCLSGYDNDIYKELGWRVESYKSPNSDSIENLWMNY